MPLKVLKVRLQNLRMDEYEGNFSCYCKAPGHDNGSDLRSVSNLTMTGPELMV